MKPLAGTAVIGIGNEFRRDDGLGWATIALLCEREARRPLPAGTELAQSDGDPGRLMALREDKALTLVVDACFPPAAQPGRTHRLCERAVRNHDPCISCSAHFLELDIERTH
ncbi:hypothetical protein ACWGIU_10565 [Streptomyces sp. NPDC054840]